MLIYKQKNISNEIKFRTALDNFNSDRGSYKKVVDTAINAIHEGKSDAIDIQKDLRSATIKMQAQCENAGFFSKIFHFLTGDTSALKEALIQSPLKSEPNHIEDLISFEEPSIEEAYFDTAKNFAEGKATLPALTIAAKQLPLPMLIPDNIKLSFLKAIRYAQNMKLDTGLEEAKNFVSKNWNYSFENPFEMYIDLYNEGCMPLNELQEKVQFAIDENPENLSLHIELFKPPVYGERDELTTFDKVFHTSKYKQVQAALTFCDTAKLRMKENPILSLHHPEEKFFNDLQRFYDRSCSFADLLKTAKTFYPSEDVKLSFIEAMQHEAGKNLPVNDSLNEAKEYVQASWGYNFDNSLNKSMVLFQKKIFDPSTFERCALYALKKINETSQEKLELGLLQRFAKKLPLYEGSDLQLKVLDQSLAFAT